MLPVPWPVAGSVLSGIGTVVLFAYIWDYRGKRSVDWFLTVLGLQALWCFSYGVSLLVFDPTIRLAFEVVTWISTLWIGVAFLAFALEYTGRGRFVSVRWFGPVAVFPVAGTMLVLSTRSHSLLWERFQVTPTFGVATVSYDLTSIGLALILLGSLCVTVGTVLLFETVVSYGSLYRTEALAVGLSALPPGVAHLVWTFQLDPTYPLNLAPIVFFLHVLLDAYAFVGGNLFTHSPVTSRVADRSAIETLENPFLVLDENERIVELNPAAEHWLDVSKPGALGLTLTQATKLDLDPTADDQLLVDDRGRVREFAVSSSPLYGPNGDLVGWTVVVQDITTQRRRKQRLEILNRILRHNLRNDLNVVGGTIDIAVDRTDDPDFQTMLEGARTDVDNLLQLAEKARQFEQLSTALETSPEPVSLRSLLETVTTEITSNSTTRIDLSVPDDVVLESYPAVLSLLFSNLLENAIEHGSADSTVTVTLTERNERAVVTVEDDGPGIPEHELAVIERGGETALEHGSGIGLWIVTWCVRTLGGDLEFETTEGTTATVRLPGAILTDDSQ